MTVKLLAPPVEAQKSMLVAADAHFVALKVVELNHYDPRSDYPARVLTSQLDHFC